MGDEAQTTTAAEPEPLLVTVRQTEELLNLGHTKTCELISAGVLESVLIGRRRLVRFTSVKALASGGKAA